MATYLIGYDLKRPGQNYAGLEKKIEAIGNWWHCLDSTWIVKTNLTAVQIRDTLAGKNSVDWNDRLLVVALTEEAAWQGFNDKCSSWLSNNL